MKLAEKLYQIAINENLDLSVRYAVTRQLRTNEIKPIPKDTQRVIFQTAWRRRNKRRWRA